MAAVVSVRPPRAKAGDEVQVRLIVGHPQENGLRRDPGTGERIARNVIRDLVCRYAGEVVFRASLGTGIAANPFLAFTLRAVRTDDVVVDWEDEAGARGSVRARLAVDA